MRDYGRVHTTFWSSSTIANLSERGKLLALFLLTCSHSTIAGVYRLPDGYVTEDLGWDAETVRETLRELSDKGFAHRCEVTRWVWIVKYLRWNPPENPNQRKAAAKVARSVPESSSWLAAFVDSCGADLDIGPLPKTNPSPTVAEPLREPFRNQKQDQDQDQDQKQEQEAPDDAKSSPRQAVLPRVALTPDAEDAANAIRQDQTLSGIVEDPDGTAVDLDALAPSIDLVAEITKAGAWLRADPKRRKKNGRRFLVGWLERAQEGGGVPRPQRTRESARDESAPALPRPDAARLAATFAAGIGTGGTTLGQRPERPTRSP